MREGMLKFNSDLQMNLFELNFCFNRRKSKFERMSKMDLESEVEFFSRVANLPLVNSAIGYASGAYYNAKVGRKYEITISISFLSNQK